MLHLHIGITALVAVVVIRSIYALWRGPKTYEIPWGLQWLRYLPRWLSGIIYSHSALKILADASERHGDKPYKIPRHDTDLIVLPRTVLNELAGLPSDIASNIHALQYDLCGRWTGLSMLQSSTLHMRVVQRRITPSIDMLTRELEDEVSSALEDLFPTGTDWQIMTPYFVMMDLAARVFSRVVVGPRYCRDSRWLDFAINFTENTFNSVRVMRHFPPWMYPLLSQALPSVRASVANIRKVEALLVPVFEDQIQKRKSNPDQSTLADAELHGIAWLTEIAVEEDLHPVKMVHALILLALGAIHTSLFSELNILYDLISDSALMEEIRTEVHDTFRRDRSTSSYEQLHKLDSVLRESQRHNPPFMIGLRRVMLADHTFGGNIHVPKGSYVCVPSYHIMNEANPQVPAAFDGLRSYALKLKENAMSSTKHIMTTTDESALGFGHGRTACPGRWLAAQTLKIIFSKLVSGYDFKSANEGWSRPQSLFSHEIVYPDKHVRILVRSRCAVDGQAQAVAH